MSDLSPKKTFYFTSLLEQKKVRYAVKKMIKNHTANCNSVCWRCHFQTQLSCGNLNIFEAYYVMQQESAHADGDGTCQAMRNHLTTIPYQTFPTARCIKRKNGSCRCSL